MQLFVWIFFYVSRIIKEDLSFLLVTYSLPIRSTDRYFYRSPNDTPGKETTSPVYIYMYLYIHLYIYIYICIYHTRTNDIVDWKTRTTEESVARSGDRPLRLAERSVTDWATDSPTPLVPSKREPRMAERGRGSPILRLVAPKAPIFASLSLQLSRYRPYT